MHENPFLTRGAAARYARSRPDVTSPVIDVLHGVHPEGIDLAVDVGCGTGQSSRALRRISQRVVAVDTSSEMLGAAEPLDGVEYLLASAEALPLDEGAANLVAAGLAMHWFDRGPFLAEARRVLRPGGSLVVWNAGCAGEGEPGAEAWAWYGGPYQRDFPPPPRDARGPDDGAARAAGFELVRRETFAVAVEFDHARFVDFLTTQSNVLAAVGQDADALRCVRERLLRETDPFFPLAVVPWRFAGWIAIFRRTT